MKVLFLTFFSLMLFACGTSSKKEESSKLQEQTVEEGACAITIRFISKGSGIDRETLKLLEDYLAKAKEEYDGKLIYTMNQKGREGERTYCIQFQKIGEKEHQEIKSELDKIVNSSELVRME